MKIAVISDVHGDTNILKKFIEFIDEEEINIVLNLGDIIGGDNPLEALRIIMNDKRFISVRGNHDSSLFLKSEMTLKERWWIKHLPLSKIVKINNIRFLMVHSRIGSNTDIPLLYDNKNIIDFLNDYDGDYDYVLFGHTHYQCLLSYYEGKTMINPGSLGLSYDGKMSFCILDLNENELNIMLKKIKV